MWDLFVGGVGGDTLCVEAWRSGGALHACRCGGKEVWRSRARETCCGPGDVDVGGDVEV